jgi:hypothetical protein
VDPRDVESFASRPWQRAAAAKQRYWRDEVGRRGPAAAFEAAQALWAHMQMVRPDWPSDEERRLDLAHHVELKRALDRVAGAPRAPASR